jgi:hypothetical protein
MTRFFLLLILAYTVTITISCKHQPYVLPLSERKGDPTLCFERDILPIFVSQCASGGCHDAGSHKKGYILDSYDNIIAKGIVPGNYAASKIYMSVTGTTEEMMPEDAAPLSSEQIALIKRWINAGALKDSACGSPCDSNNYTYSNGIQPLMSKYCIGCHGSSSPQGILVLLSYSQVKDAVQNRNLMKCVKYETGYSGMPKGGLHLSQCQIRQLEKWIDSGMQNN